MAATKRWGAVLAGTMLAALACGHAQAQSPTYKCVQGKRVVYSQTVCPGARELGTGGKPRINVRYETPPQDRAKAARRAGLSEKARGECKLLDHRIQDQEAELRARGSAATLHDEMPLVDAKQRYNRLHC